MNRRQFLGAAAGVSALGALPTQARKRPNILYILPDQLRSFSLGCYGNTEVHTPHIDRLATRSIRFGNALSAAPTCSPYRVQMLTGQYAHVGGEKLSPSAQTLYRELESAGYHVGHIGKWHMTPDHLKTDSGYVPPEVRKGIAYAALNEVTHKYQHSMYWVQNDLQSRDAGPWEPDAHAQLAIEFLERRSKLPEQPFFLTLALGPPHPPYSPIPRYNVFNPADVTRRPNVPVDASDADRKRLAKYYGLIYAVDEVVGRVLNTLEEEGLAENTIVILTSDHGDMLQSQGMTGKRKPYEEAIKVPFLLSSPGRFEPGLRDDLFSSVDVMPTLLELCGLETPDYVQGRSILSNAPRDSVYIQITMPSRTPHRSPWRSVLTADGWKYASSRKVDDWLLFNLEEDPFEQHNLIADSGHAKKKNELRELIRTWAGQTGDEFFS